MLCHTACPLREKPKVGLPMLSAKNSEETMLGESSGRYDTWKARPERKTLESAIHVSLSSVSYS